MKKIILALLLCYTSSGYGVFSGTFPDKLHCATCRGSEDCRACSSCNYCKHCNSGGKCGVCVSGKRLPAKPVRDSDSDVSGQCKGTTKKGARCKRTVRGGGYCWQHA